MKTQSFTFNLVWVACLCLMSHTVFGQKSVEQIFRKYKNDEGVMNVNFTGEVKKYLQSSNAKFKSEIDNIDIYVFEAKKNISSKDRNQIQESLAKDKYDLLVDVKDKSSNVKLYVLDEGKHVSKVYAQVINGESNIHFMLSGKIILEELSKLNLSFAGSDALKMLGDGKY